MKLSMFPLVLVAVLILVSVSANAGIIDTTPYWNYDNSVGVFGGGPGTLTTFGQTFTVGEDSVLQSFSFFLNSYADNNAPVNFKAYIMRWSTISASGPVLYESAPLTFTPSDLLFHEITNDTGGVQLVAGQQYVAFFSTTGVFDGVLDTARMGKISQPTQPYTHVGSFVFQDTRTFSDLTTSIWAVDDVDAAFKASFTSPSAVPETGSTLLFLGIGITGVLAIGLKYGTV